MRALMGLSEVGECRYFRVPLMVVSFIHQLILVPREMPNIFIYSIKTLERFFLHSKCHPTNYLDGVTYPREPTVRPFQKVIKNSALKRGEIKGFVHFYTDLKTLLIHIYSL